MGVLKTVVIVILSISFVVFIALFGRLPAFRRTPIGFLHRLLLLHIPNGLAKIDGVLTGGRIFRSVSSTVHYLMHEKHPIVLIFFAGLQVAGEVLMLPVVYPELGLVNRLIIPPLVLLPYYYLYLCATISSSIPVHSPSHQDNNTSDYPDQRHSPAPSPSSLHPSHHSALTAYPYDHLLFHPGYFCPTCQHPKPARSKHCSLCRACIQRQDHHCIWINNCVGRNNHVYFFLLLISTTALLAYGSLLGYGHLTSLLTARFAPTALLKGSSSAKTTTWRQRFSWSELLNAYIWAFTRSPAVGATTLLTIMCTPLAAAFLLYHLYLLYIGATTNETAKWADWRDDIADGLVWRARMSDLRSGAHAYAPLPEHVEPRSQEVDWPPRRIPRWLWKPGRAYTHRPGQAYRPQYWYIYTRNGDPPTIKLRDGQVIDDTRWERVRSLRKEVDNVYDLGFWGNMCEVIFHREANV